VALFAGGAGGDEERLASKKNKGDCGDGDEWKDFNLLFYLENVE
jgi:hypothetical protein